MGGVNPMEPSANPSLYVDDSPKPSYLSYLHRCRWLLNYRHSNLRLFDWRDYSNRNWIGLYLYLGCFWPRLLNDNRRWLIITSFRLARCRTLSITLGQFPIWNLNFFRQVMINYRLNDSNMSNERSPLKRHAQLVSSKTRLAQFIQHMNIELINMI